MTNRELVAETIRVRGTVQGVGFRPTVYRLAQELSLRGEVGNDGEGVFIEVIGTQTAIDTFVGRLQQESPPLAKISAIARHPHPLLQEYPDFAIAPSYQSPIRTEIPADAATCPACQAEIFNPVSRWYHYPFTNCTHCGPRLSIIQHLPYDRAHTTMAGFQMCPECNHDYHDPNNRRFHAQPTACPKCGPKVWIEKAETASEDVEEAENVIDRVVNLLQQGYIVAIRGLGGFHLACDATNEESVQQLRQRKHRPHKPLALMARDMEIIEQYCTVSEAEKELLTSVAAPIVLLSRRELGNLLNRAIAPSVAPEQNQLGFMLPYTPLHHLLFTRLDIPLVMTSGNLSSEPQCIDNQETRTKLDKIADYFLFHNREIVNRVDDSIARIDHFSQLPHIQILRRARGYAPTPIDLPVDCPDTPPILAMGSELKNTFCLLRNKQAIISQHIGDLANATALTTYRQTLDLYLNLLEHQPAAIAIDLHPEYLSTKLGKQLAETHSLPLYSIQHHHAHIAACLVENHIPFHNPPVLGIALDGLGYGEDGTFWGGEFLLADYRSFKRLGTFKPIPMIGGIQAIYQPWRNTYAHLSQSNCNSAMLTPFEQGKWQELEYRDLDIFKFLQQKPTQLLDRMMEKGINSPLASSCGRLFDAVAAAIGICRESCSYEGQGAIALESLAERSLFNPVQPIEPYPFTIDHQPLPGQLDLPYLEPHLMWQALLQDLKNNVSQSVIAAKFHLGLANAIASLVQHICHHLPDLTIQQVALSGGVFQNQILLHQVRTHLEAMHLQVLTHRQIPPNDGGLSLGQVAIATAQFHKQ